MLKSMTGYGKAEISVSDKKITVEIKSLNSKNADINIKIPYLYKDKELEIRQLIHDRLVRGKIDINLFYELHEGIAPGSINTDKAKAYYLQLKQLSSDLNLSGKENFLDIIMRLPDTLKVDKGSADETEWEYIKQTFLAAIEDVDRFRIHEGKSLEADIISHTNNISHLLSEINKFEKSRIELLRKKFLTQIQDLGSNIEVDNSRLEQELIFYVEKLDISEEKSRLQNHLEYFLETLQNEVSVGKKLGFISQEMGREINTLGSKAFDFDIQKLVVQMKDELEKIKEQILNVL